MKNDSTIQARSWGRRLPLCYLLFLVALQPVCSRGDDFQAVPPSDRAGVWQQFDAAQQHITNFVATVTQTKTLKVLQQPIVSEAKLSFCRPNLFRWEVVKPSASLTLSDGQWLWMYYPEFQQAERYLVNDPRLGGSPMKSLGATLGANPATLTNTCEVTVSENARQYRLDVVPRDAREKQFLARLVLDFDRATLLVTRSVMESPNGDQTVNEYRDGKTNQPMDDAWFHFTPPAGVKVVTPFSK